MTSAGPSDEVLFEKYAAGDKKAGQALFSRHFDAINRFFRRQLGDDVGDLVQNTFLGLVNAKDRFEGRSTVRTFLFRIARNQLYNELRRRKKGEPIDFGVTSIVDLAPSPSRALREMEEIGLLVEALARLPIEQQITINLYYLEELPAAGGRAPRQKSRLRRRPAPEGRKVRGSRGALP